MQRLNILWSALFFCLLFAKSIEAFADNSRTMQLPFSSGEILYYKLSYRGLLTSMIWADLADIKMTFSANQQTPDKQNAYQFEMYLTTENYTKAEMFQAVRYTYKTTLDSNLLRTVLVEEIDTGRKHSHDFLWLDWKNKQTQLYKKREKIPQESGLFAMEFKEVWEKDGTHSIPDFLKKFPLLEDQQTYLIHKESGDRIEHSRILDPLSLIYTIRTFSLTSASSLLKEIPVALSDDIRLYRIEKQFLDTIVLNGKKVQGIKLKVQTDEKKENHYYLWLSNDNYKTPLRIVMDAPLGKLEINLVKIEHSEL